MGDHLKTKFSALGAKSRRLLIDASLCFVATWLIAFLPPQWKNGEALKEIAFTTDPVSGKIIDRIESAETERPSLELKSASPAAALFAVYPQERISDWSNSEWSNEAAAEQTETIPVRPTKVVALRRPSPEKRNPVESTPPAPPTYNAEPPASPQTMGENAEQQERSLLAKLDPTGLSSKLAPLGRKAWNSATLLGGAVSSLVNAYPF
ncbi:hypothetical protein IYX23_08345 [Methylocystis sp. L43]|jgi:hypothetical protein|uniref:hypothetical protein n=1 Tax=unclassified Methylocystis TaxID=2625913 RepID=UPI0018C289FA|nr:MULTISPECIES: hypothetical protein [unclassified Methylocystis]MBG0797678.1 hypothetical protein [Methylocystis sp. L43]MBG0805284.1 hypothetical protein [Methylocystis sp. H15]